MMYQNKRVRDLLYNTHHVYVLGFEATERVIPSIKEVQKVAPNASMDPNKMRVTRPCVVSTNHYAASIADKCYTCTTMNNPGITAWIKSDVWTRYSINASSLRWIYSEAVTLRNDTRICIHHYIMNDTRYLTCMLVYQQCNARPEVQYYYKYDTNHYDRQDYFNLVRHYCTST